MKKTVALLAVAMAFLLGLLCFAGCKKASVNEMPTASLEPTELLPQDTASPADTVNPSAPAVETTFPATEETTPAVELTPEPTPAPATAEEALARLKDAETGNDVLVLLVQYEAMLGIKMEPFLALDGIEQEAALVSIMQGLGDVSSLKALSRLVNDAVSGAKAHTGAVGWLREYPKASAGKLLFKTQHESVVYYVVLPGVLDGDAPKSAAEVVAWCDVNGAIPDDLAGLAVVGDIRVNNMKETAVSLHGLDSGETYRVYCCTRNGAKVGAFAVVAFVMP